MSSLDVINLRKEYGASIAVSKVDFSLKQGELVAILGPSGCGKTTTLRMVAGFIEPTAGSVCIGDIDVTRMPPHQRDTGMVFQGYALFPHMTIAQNVGFGLEMRRIPAPERVTKIREALRLVRMEGHADKYPRQLSGGQQQRVAIARALVVSPKVFLLDEPLSNLDARLRHDVRQEIRNLQQRLGLTTLMVTHDQEEALTMADRMIVMEGGRVRQVGTPRDLYERPDNVFVARFLGRCNTIQGTYHGSDGFAVKGISVPCSRSEVKSPDTLIVRPESVKLSTTGNGFVRGRISAISYLGNMVEWQMDTEVGKLIATHPTPPNGDPLSRLGVDDLVTAQWTPEAALPLNSEA